MDIRVLRDIGIWQSLNLSYANIIPHSLNEILNRQSTISFSFWQLLILVIYVFNYLCFLLLNLPCSWAARDSCWWRHCTCISWSLVISEMVLRYTIIVKITATAQPPYKARRPPRPLPSREPLITVDKKKYIHYNIICYKNNRGCSMNGILSQNHAYVYLSVMSI